MRRYNIAISALLVMMTAFSTYAAGKVSWLETEYDFGTFSEELGKVSGKIRFVNTGDADVVISEVRPTCGCTASDYPRMPIAPGDTAAIMLTYNPYGRPGAFNKDVIVHVNVEPKRFKIAVKGNVIGSPSTVNEKFPVSVGALKISASTIPYGELLKGRQKMAYLDGYNTGSDSIKVLTADASDYIVADVVPPVVPPGGICTITTYYDTRKNPDWGISVGGYNVYTESVSQSASSLTGIAHIDVVAILNEDFSKMSDKELEYAPSQVLSSSKVDYGTLDRRSSASRSFTITNKGKRKLEIRKIFTTDKFVRIDVDKNIVKKGKLATVTVTVSPEAIENDFLNSKITIITNDPQNSRSYVRLVGLIK